MVLDSDEPTAKEDTLLKKLEEFDTYIKNNAGFIPNYGERSRYGETISTPSTLGGNRKKLLTISTFKIYTHVSLKLMEL